MKLLFIRHGKAMERGSMPDAERYLTEAGIQGLKTYFPYLAESLRGQDTVIWTSELIRSVETGRILAEEIGTGETVIKAFVQNGKIEQLLDALYELEPGVLPIIVGHEPHLSVWTYKLTGEEYFFKKGAVLLLETGDYYGRGEVLATSRLKELKNFRPEL